MIEASMYGLVSFVFQLRLSVFEEKKSEQVCRSNIFCFLHIQVYNHVIVGKIFV